MITENTIRTKAVKTPPVLKAMPTVRGLRNAEPRIITRRNGAKVSVNALIS